MMDAAANYPEYAKHSINRSHQGDVPEAVPQDALERCHPYRIIPVRPTSDRLSVSRSRCDNVSGVRDVPKPREVSPNGSGSDRRVQFRGSQVVAVHHQRQDGVGSERTSYKEHRQAVLNSRSEPALEMVKARGDSNALEAAIEEDDHSAKGSEFGDFNAMEEGPGSKEGGLRGYVLFKSGGKVYRSSISADEIRPQRANDSVGWKSLATGQGCGDFDVAIFLTGLDAKKPARSHPKQSRGGSKNAKDTQDYADDWQRFRLREEAGPVYGGRSLESAYEKYALKLPSAKIGLTKFPEKERKVAKRSSPFSFNADRMAMYRMASGGHRPRDAESAISSASEGESVHRAPQNLIRSKYFQEPIVINDRVLPRERISVGRKRHEAECKSSDVSQSSLFRDFGGLGKIGEEELFDVFESIFRRYSSTSRHAGDVISRQISTAWMANAGVVGEVLTRKEADETFKKAAGARITMNSKEYKEFLIKLTLRLKLPYYEIYHRMCGIEA